MTGLSEAAFLQVGQVVYVRRIKILYEKRSAFFSDFHEMRYYTGIYIRYW